MQYPNDTSNIGVRLNSDGTYTGVYSNGGSASRLYTTTPSSGTWRYFKNGDGSGTIMLKRSDAGDAPLEVYQRTLAAQGEDCGTVFGRATAMSLAMKPLTFRLTPPGALPSFSNSSVRSFVRPGGVAVLGFVIQNADRAVLIRAVGPGLRAYGVTTTLSDPQLSVASLAGGRPAFTTNNDWDHQSGAVKADSITRSALLVGAFPLETDAKDAATVVTLSPGAYTVQVSGVSPDDSGEVLIEVYVLP